MSPLVAARRAARRNPFYAPALVCTYATENGLTLYDESGTVIYEGAEETFGFVDRTKETLEAMPPRQGKALVNVLTELPPETIRAIRIRGRVHIVRELHSSDVGGISLRFECTSLDPAEAPTIREASP